MENRFFRLEVARLTGEFSLYDKVNDRMLLDHAAILGLEERRGEYIYQMELSGRTIPAVIDSVEITENNAVFCRVEIRGSVYEQPFVQHLTLSADSPELEIDNTIEWRGRRYVRLEQSFPFVSAETAEIRYGVPFGAVRFPESVYQPDGKVPDETKQQDPAWNIRLVRDWVDISDSLGGATIAADHRMWTFQENTLRNCMIRGIGWTSGGVHLREDRHTGGGSASARGNLSFPLPDSSAWRRRRNLCASRMGTEYAHAEWRGRHRRGLSASGTAASETSRNNRFFRDCQLCQTGGKSAWNPCPLF